MVVTAADLVALSVCATATFSALSLSNCSRV
jgi:hypothetical protein